MASLLRKVTCDGFTKRALKKDCFQIKKKFTRMMATELASSPVTNHDGDPLASAKPLEEMPGFRSFPIIGTMWTFFPFIGKYSLSKGHIADRDKYEKFGDIAVENLRKINVVISFNPDDIETVFRNEGQYPVRPPLASLKAYRESRKEWYSTTGIIVLTGKEWRDLRSKVQPYLLKPLAIQAYSSSMQAIAHDLVRRMRFVRDENEEIPDFLNELYKWALESVAFVGLDKRLGCLENDLPLDSEPLQMIRAVQTTFGSLDKLEVIAMSVPLWTYLPIPSRIKLFKAMDVFTKIALKYINRALEEIKNNNDPDKELTLLQSMLCREDFHVPDAIVTVCDMLMAGIDTTSHSTGFLLYNLAKNPEKQEKLHREVTEILPSKSDTLSSTQLNQMKYLRACIKEGLRMDPVTRGTARILEHDTILSGYKVPAGTLVFMATQVATRLEKHFKNANQFIPERWLDRENKPHPFLYLPFGFGPRGCIGRRLAELEMMCVITEIVKNFKVEYHHEDIGMNTRLVNVPDRPLKFKFIDRV